MQNSELNTPRSLGVFSRDGLQGHCCWAFGIFAAALLLRLLVLAATFQGNDSVYYYDDAKIALNLIAGNGYSISYEYRNWLFYESVLKTAKLRDPVTEGTRITAVKQPAYPLLLAGIFYCFGPKNFLMVFLLQAGLSSLTAVVIFLALRKSRPLLALVTALCLTLYPPMFIHAVTTPESTTLLLFLIAALWLFLVKIKESPSWRVWLLVGTVGGLAVLTEPVTVPLLGLCLCYALYLDKRPNRIRLRGLAAGISIVVIIVSPWLLRNYVAFNRFPVLKSGLGLVFNWGLHFSGRGTWISEEKMVTLEERGRNLSELQEDEAIRRELRSLFPSHWREYVTYNIPSNFLHLWWDVKRYWNNYSLGYLLGRRIPYLLVLALALPSLFQLTARLVRRPRAGLRHSVLEVAALLLIGSYTVLYSLFGSFHSRYRLPVEMALLVFAGVTIRPAVERLWNRWTPASRLVGDDPVSRVLNLLRKI
jgi:4-amino-4-deoxy-L-arabinose transferase-like glycosyltransferase